MLRAGGLARVLTSLWALATVSSIGAEASAQDYFEQWPVELQTEVTHLYRSFNGEIMLYVKDLATGYKYTHNSATPMYIASGVKMAVMVELFRQVKAKRVRLDEEVIYGPMDTRDGAPVMSYLRVGTPVQMRILLESMIQQSDNAATDMILRRIGVPNVNRGLDEENIFGFGPITTLLDVRKLVYKEIDPRAMQLTPAELTSIGVAENMGARLARLEDLFHEQPGTFTTTDFDRAFNAYYRTGNNSAPLDAVGILLERLAKKTLVSMEASKQMLEVMMGTQTGARRARAGLPLGTPFAHKTGTQYRRICDLGIFYISEKKPVVFAMCVKGGQTRRRAEEVIAHVAQRTYWLMLPPDKRPTLPAEVTIPDVEDDAETRVAPEVGGKKGLHNGKAPAKLKPLKRGSQRVVEHTPDVLPKRKRSNAVD
jgi:beta-lactamase class A